MGAPIDLSQARNDAFRRGRPRWVEAIWMLVEWIFVTNALQPSSRVRVLVLRWFGAKVGSSVTIRPRTRVKYPWRLSVGRNCWIGEGVWLHNQAQLVLEDNVVVSQETFITTGSHAASTTMDLVVAPVRIRQGAWITSRCVVLMGSDVGASSLVTPMSVVRGKLLPGMVYGGNPCRLIRPRFAEDDVR